MSYEQIFQRIKRILQSEIHDAYARWRQEEQDLHDFDAELNRAAGETNAKANPDQATSGRSQGEPAGRSWGANTGSAGHERTSGRQHDRPGTGPSGKRQTPPHTEGKRKPGEREDAYYCGILGVPVNASVADIRNAYRRLMRRYHPDKVATLGTAEQKAASEKAQAINEAYQIIARRRKFK